MTTKEEVKIGSAKIATVLSKEDIKYYDIEKQRSHKADFKEVLGSSKLFVRNMSVVFLSLS